MSFETYSKVGPKSYFLLVDSYRIEPVQKEDREKERINHILKIRPNNIKRTMKTVRRNLHRTHPIYLKTGKL